MFGGTKLSVAWSRAELGLYLVWTRFGGDRQIL